MKRHIFIVFSFFVSTVFFYQLNNHYSIFLTFEAINLNADEIDNQIGQKIINCISKIDKVKDYIIISKKDYCNLYIKLNPFILNKKAHTALIEEQLKNEINDYRVNFNDEYDYKYQTFFIVSSKNKSYKELRVIYDDILEELYNLKIAKKINTEGLFEIADYINFNCNNLLKYDINISDIKNLIEKANLKTTTARKTSKHDFIISINSDIDNVSDIKNIAINYKDKNFATLFKNIFLIEEKIKTPPRGLVFMDDEKALSFALSKKKIYPDILFYYKLENLKKELEKIYPDFSFNIINIKKYKKFQLYFDYSESIDNLYSYYSEILKKVNPNKSCWFLAIPFPKTKNREEFFEYENNRLIILTSKKDSRKLENYLKKSSYDYIKENYKTKEITDDKIDDLIKKIPENSINQLTNKVLGLGYKIDEYSLKDYTLLKSEVIDTILALNDGLSAGKYFDNKIEKEIIIKNPLKNQEFVYSKDYKTLIPIDAVSEVFSRNNFYTIARKNGKYYTNLIYKK